MQPRGESRGGFALDENAARIRTVDKAFGLIYD